MIIKAVVRLQACVSSGLSLERVPDRSGFVARGREAHGIAKGRIGWYCVTAESWAGIRRVLKHWDVMGYSMVGPATVESHTRDIGSRPGGVQPVFPPAPAASPAPLIDLILKGVNHE